LALLTRKHGSGTEEANPEEVLLKYWPQVSFRVKKSIGHSAPDWEDIVSEILLNVIEAIRRDKYRGECSLGTFIYAVTTNKIIDHIRQKKKVLGGIHESGQDFDPALQAETRERVRQVAGCLKKLKPKYADIMYLHYYLDLPLCEIARIYGTSAGTMHKLVKVARNNLKDLMKTLMAEEENARKPLPARSKRIRPPHEIVR
jgi:RNA polymerase sigma-70 factor, ECF subfamily